MRLTGLGDINTVAQAIHKLGIIVRMFKRRDLTGQRFGYLTVLQFAAAGRHAWYLCRCDCGTEQLLNSSDLPKLKSCGCKTSSLIAESKRTHGHTFKYAITPEYTSWAKMRERCYNPNSRDWPDYGGRGITVCDRWRDSFTAFLADVGRRPVGYSLDRYPDVNGNYEPGNVRWATPSQQARNRRTTHLYHFNGQGKTLAEWSELTGIKEGSLLSRIMRGWSVENALTIPTLTTWPRGKGKSCASAT